MKIRLDVDCTPEEARRFLGLPDVQPLQKAVMATIQERIEQGLSGDTEALLKTWLPASIQGFEALQKMFWAQAGAATGDSDKDRKK
ncbi:MAG: hypothetical protein FJX47_06850 [Alphaproteobacteria bacterium]|nr:hypothetical protein [Alphaproteobacteria bacterium]